jgi:hypothetical protein
VSDVATVSVCRARVALVGEDDATARFARSLSERGAARTALRGVRRLTGTALETIDGEIASVLDDLLDVDIGDALVMGWQKHSALRAAAERTVTTAIVEEVVVLATHRITWTARPAIDLLIEGRRVNSFEFELSVVVDVIGLTAVVRRGYLVGLRGGECVIAATLKLEGGTLAQRRHHLGLERHLRLRAAVELARPPEPTPRDGDVELPADGQRGWLGPQPA